MVFRAIPFVIKTSEELMLPEVVDELADEERGIILLTGTTGSGKSTTLAAMIDRINSTSAKHIVTIEDPIEYMHRDKRSIINQREVGDDTNSFGRALRRVLRQDPDVILVGEMRDEETVRTACPPPRPATSCCPPSTPWTPPRPSTASSTSSREGEQRQARAMLAGTLKGVISQRLVPTPDGNGRIATCEVLRMTGRVKDMILNPEETGKLPEVIKEGGYYGMQTFDQALLAHVQSGRVDMEDRHEVRHPPARLQAAGLLRRPALDVHRQRDADGRARLADLHPDAAAVLRALVARVRRAGLQRRARSRPPVAVRAPRAGSRSGR